MTAQIAIKNIAKERLLFKQRVIFAAAAVTLLFLLLIVRLAYLQIWQHHRYATLSRQNRLELLPIEPNRGLIYDRNGVLVAENIPVFSLDIIHDHVRNIAETIDELQKIVPISKDDIKQFYRALRQHHSSEPAPLKYKLSEQETAYFYVNQYKFSGVVINARLIRNYPLGKTMASVLGYVGRINAKELQQVDSTNYSATNFIGKTGIEKQYETRLHGTVGYQQVEIDAAGHIVRTIKKVPPIPGDNLYLTIDSKLQAAAENALGDECGAVVAIQPKTGQVLALVSNPGFDPNLFVQGITEQQYSEMRESPDNPLFNRAIRGEFPIASTIKPFLALEGLDTGIITPNYTIHDPGWFQLPNTKHIYRDWNWLNGGHGDVNVTKAIIVSSDPFFYNLAVLLGIYKIDDILNRFGFGYKTGIDMPDEKSGLVPSPEWKSRIHGQHWYAGDTVISGIGQGFMLTTPLQLASAAATLANSGLRYRPQFLLKTITPNELTYEQKPIPEDPVMIRHPEVWHIVIHAMEGVVHSSNPWGTARLRFGTNPQYSVAAKTGTGQVYSRHGRDEEEHTQTNISKRLRTHSLFIAFAPVKDPKIAIGVIVEHSTIAGTVARKVLDYYLLTEHSPHENMPNK